jgi:hypothetical protein
MLDKTVLASVAKQLMTSNTVALDGKSLPVRRTSSQRLRTVTFSMDGREYQAIEQNPEKPSRWGQLAKAGHSVVQFKDSESNRFVAVAVDGDGQGVRLSGRAEAAAEVNWALPARSVRE